MGSVARRTVTVMSVLFAVGVLGSVGSAQTVADQVIAREKASYEAWQKMDKAFIAELLADDSTSFMPDNPYLAAEPKVNFLPRLDKFFARFKMRDFTMYNPRVQVYGEVAILTYNEVVSGTADGTPFTYSGKVTSVYVKTGGTWKVVHSHESVNPSPH